jgi:hypothetical protein
MQEDAMTTRSRFTCVGACLVASLVAAVATAGIIDKRTTFTFNTPIAVPGVTLPAGSYLFHLADTDNTRDVVQVLSADGKTAYAMFFTLQTWRAEPAKDPELTFIETAADMPHAIRTWWNPGESIGYDFLYPREQARLLARGSGTPVLGVETLPPRWTEPVLMPPSLEEELPALTPETVAVAEEPPVVAPEAPAIEELPATASPTTVLLLTAVLLVAAAAALQLVARRQPR